MRTIDKYNYTLYKEEYDDSGEMQRTSSAVTPIHSKLNKKYSRPSDEMYYTETLDSEIYLQGSDAEKVIDAKVSSKFTLVVTNASTGNEVARCDFRKSNCEIDVNHNEVKISPSDDSEYDGLDGKLDDEVDIKPLHPAMKNLTMQIRPALQFYMLGSNYVTTQTYSGIVQKEITSVDDESEVTSAKFGKSNALYYARVVSQGEYLSGYIKNFSPSGSGDIDITGSVTLRLSQNGASKIVYGLYIGGTLQASVTSSIDWSDRFSLKGESVSFTITYLGSEVEVTIKDLSCYHVYSRLLYYRDDDDYAYDKIGSDDAFAPGVYNRALSVVIGGSYVNDLVMSLATTSEVTDYGKFDNTLYYAKPSSTMSISPIGQDVWNGNASLWADGVTLLSALISSLPSSSTTKTLHDWYSFGSALEVVLKKLDSNILFEDGNTEYSQFLFAANNPVLSTESVTAQQGRLYILQKSNLLSLTYDVSSNQNKVTLRKMLQFLKYALNCYWHFERVPQSDGTYKYKFHVEHVSYYLNGGSYSDDTREIVDLTTLYDPFNGKPQSFLTNRWSYDIGTGNGTATKIKYNWMDEQTEAFDGVAIEVPDESRILKDDTIEERTIDWFSSDIDYLIANKENVSNDGFLVVWTTSQSNDSLPIDSLASSPTYMCQNYRLAIEWLSQHILLYNIGSKYVKINNKSLNREVRGVKSMRKADIKFMPKRDQDITPDVKLNTEVGEGVINEMTIDLTSGLVEATVLYKLED